MYLATAAAAAAPTPTSLSSSRASIASLSCSCSTANSREIASESLREAAKIPIPKKKSAQDQVLLEKNQFTWVESQYSLTSAILQNEMSFLIF